MLYGTKNQRAILAVDLRADDRRAADRARAYTELLARPTLDLAAGGCAASQEHFVRGEPAPRPVPTPVFMSLPLQEVPRS